MNYENRKKFFADIKGIKEKNSVIILNWRIICKLKYFTIFFTKQVKIYI